MTDDGKYQMDYDLDKISDSIRQRLSSTFTCITHDEIEQFSFV